MRLAPVPMYYSPDETKVRHFSRESSRTTHGAAECLDACEILGTMLYRALHSASKESVVAPVDLSPATEAIGAVNAGTWKTKGGDQIAGTGYVVESLEAALWCFHTTNSFAECVLRAANLGDDADTTAAISGQLAGAFYGVESIPADWISRLSMSADIEKMAASLHAS